MRRKRIELPDLSVLASYISFFPQLIAGPIVRIQDVDHQFRRIRGGVLRPDFRDGLKLLIFGLAGKTIADVLAYSLNLYRLGTTVSFFDTNFVLLAYSLRIYMDFWAYSTMAVGLGKMFSINLPRNFLEPYFALNPRDFWRRWHVTLSFWLRDYVYIPLGGNKHYIRNILIVFAVCGLWHGAGWNFVIWGIYHGVLVAGYRIVEPLWNAMPRAMQWALNFVLVSLAWPLFFLSIDDFMSFMAGLSGVAGFGLEVFQGKQELLVLLVATLWVFGQRESKWLYPEEAVGWRYRLSESVVLQGFLLAGSIIFLDFSRTFIYFRF
jgi:alginate O-acetyltransferase complex protein AlgI